MKKEERAAEKPVWRTIATYSFLAEAMGLRTRLESEGIRTFIPEEFTSSINPLATALQIRLQVGSEDFERSLTILGSDSNSEQSTCPDCGGDLKEQAGTQRAQNWLRAALGLLFALPMRAKNRAWQCEKCGKKF